MPQSILIIDDEPNLRCTLSLLLGTAGYLVYTAATANQAFELMRTHVYDLVFVDVKLPFENEQKLLLQIFELTPSTPVLVLSPHESLYEDEVLKTRTHALLIKPVDPAAILFQVHRIIGQHSVCSRMQIPLAE